MQRDGKGLNCAGYDVGYEGYVDWAAQDVDQIIK